MILIFLQIEKKLKLKQELEALILKEEQERELLEEKINNIQEEEIKIVRRIKNGNNETDQDSYEYSNKKTSSKSSNSLQKR